MRILRNLASPTRKRLAAWRRGLGPACAALLAMLSAAPQAQATDTLARIASTHRIVIGYRQDSLPFSYVANGKVTGYATEICLDIVKNLARQLKLDHLDVGYRIVTASDRFIQLDKGSVDMECATTTNNAERRKLAEFSYPYFFTTTSFVSKKQEGLRTIADLAGHSVTATSGTIDLDQLNHANLARHLHISVLLQREHDDSFHMVETGQASAFVMDRIVLAGLVSASSHPEDYIVSEDAFNAPEPYGIAMPAGDTAFKHAVDQALQELFASPEIDRLYARWFMQPIPPSGRNLNLPMSPELRDWIASPREYLN